MMLLIKDWKRAWRYLSIQAAAGLVVVDVLADELPLVREALGDDWHRYAAVGIIVARLLAQPAVSGNQVGRVGVSGGRPDVAGNGRPNGSAGTPGIGADAGDGEAGQ